MLTNSLSLPSRLATCCLTGAAAAVLALSWANAAEAKAPEAEDEKLLYFIGTSVAGNLKDFQLSPSESKLVLQGFTEALGGDATEFDRMEFGRKAQTLLQERRAVGVAAEREATTEFMAEAAKASGVKQSASGLLYTETEEGSGATPTKESRVRVHYEGKLRDGSVFDSSLQRGVPAEFPLSGVIPCWQEGLAMMKVGGRAQLVCPPDIAYGDRGAPPRIPGGAVLLFDVELIDILE